MLQAFGRSMILAAGLLVALPLRAAVVSRPLLGIGLEGRYDDDALGVGADDFMTKLSPEIGYERRSRTSDLLGTYHLDMVHHAEAGNLTFDHRGLFDWRNELSRRWTLNLDASLYRVQDTTTLPRFGIAYVGAPALWAHAEGAARYRFNRRDFFEVGYIGDATQVYADGLPLGVENEPFVRIGRMVTRRLELSSRYRLQFFTADADPVGQSHSASIAGRYRLTRHSFLEAEVGPMYYLPEGQAGRWVPRGFAQYGYAARATELGLVGGHDLVGAAGYASAIWAQYLQAYVGYRPVRPLGLYLAGGVFRNGIAPDGPVTVEGYGGSVGADWRFAEGFTFHASYDRIGQFATGVAEAELARNIVVARISYLTP